MNYKTMNKTDYIIAGILGIYLGAFGAHYLYMNRNKEATTYILASTIGGLFTFGISTIIMTILGLVEGIKLLVKGLQMVSQESKQSNQASNNTTYQSQNNSQPLNQKELDINKYRYPNQ